MEKEELLNECGLCAPSSPISGSVSVATPLADGSSLPRGGLLRPSSPTRGSYVYMQVKEIRTVQRGGNPFRLSGKDEAGDPVEGHLVPGI